MSLSGIFASFIPRMQDCKVACIFASLWSFQLIGVYRENTAPIDFALFTFHVFTYFCFWLVVNYVFRMSMLWWSKDVPEEGVLRAGQAYCSVYFSVFLYVFWLFRKVYGFRWFISLTLVLLIVCAAAALIRGRYLARFSVRSVFRSSRLLSYAALLSMSILLFSSFANRFVFPNIGKRVFDNIAAEVSDDSKLRVRLLAIDGVDLNVLRELLVEDRLPHFEHLVENGAVGYLDTISPHSPVVWNSIATGVSPGKHGVESYTDSYLVDTSVVLPAPIRFDFLGEVSQRAFRYREIRASSSNTRKAKTLWDVLSMFGRKSLLVNWWTSYPAEDILGMIVSNFAIPWDGFTEKEIGRLTKRSRLVSPQNRLKEVLEIVNEVANETGNYEPKEEYDEEYFRLRDEIAFRIYRHLYEESYSYSSVYLQSIDTYSHAYTDAVFGENVNEMRQLRMSERESDLLWQGLVRKAYEQTDKKLGSILKELSEEDCLVVVSDHGWKYDGTSHWRLPPGVCLFYGTPFKKGTVIADAHVYDIFPTLAYLLNIPVSRELEGRILLDAFTDSFKNSTNIQYAATYGSRGQKLSVERPEEDEEFLDKLRELGYIR